MRNIFDRHLVLYILIGIWGAVVDFGSFYIINSILDEHYIVANTISSCLGILNNFIFNYKYNFKVNNNFIKRCIVFFAIGLCGMVVSNFVMLMLVEYCSLSSMFAKCTALCIVVAAQYTINRFVTFKNESAVFS
ncbi:GtrA family protein [Maridesulfovibrio zosterae]|uniref:GtrA family protein n=1 Tax=Maridesulfovibrio zosterae TaxID=82171 RepID=UPI0004295A44|nr:GtrA family protein [Maridesulfovibrio zosterae]